jgi:hypothetical protein
VCWPPNRHKIDNKTRFKLGTKFPGYSFNELGKEIKNKIVKREQIMEDGIKHYIAHTTLVPYMFFYHFGRL